MTVSTNHDHYFNATTANSYKIALKFVKIIFTTHYISVQETRRSLSEGVLKFFQNLSNKNGIGMTKTLKCFNDIPN